MTFDTIALAGVPLAVAIVAVSFQHRRHVFRGAVAIVVFSAVVIVGVLVRADRIAAAQQSVPQSAEWHRGARDTRNTAMTVMPIIGSSLFALGALVLMPPRPSD
jgi:hypothetical protein